jgi:Protein of unknown function (DUF3768)
MAMSAAQIREMNDRLRADCPNWRVWFSDGIWELPHVDQAAILDGVKRFSAFPDTDPFDRHNSGTFDYFGQGIVWMIEYYDAKLRQRRESPDDPTAKDWVLMIRFDDEE